MSRLETTISMQLEIIPGNKILLPGCEPTSALSSNKLSSWLAASGCTDGALINLDDALNAIPGSYVKYGFNFNRGGMRQKWFVLPPRDTDCPCAPNNDWYSVLKGLDSEEPEIEDVYDHCNINGMGFCPSPDFNDTVAPLPDPYKEEGSFPAGVGVLPPIPPWGTSGT